SAANLCFMSTWLSLFNSTNFFLKAPPASVHFVAALMNLIVGTGAIIVFLVISRNLRNKGLNAWLRFLALFVPAVIGIIALLQGRGNFGRIISTSSGFGVLLIVATLTFFFLSRYALTVVETVLIVLSPFVFVTFSQTVFVFLASPPPQPQENP